MMNLTTTSANKADFSKEEMESRKFEKSCNEHFDDALWGDDGQ